MPRGPRGSLQALTFAAAAAAPAAMVPLQRRCCEQFVSERRHKANCYSQQCTAAAGLSIPAQGSRMYCLSHTAPAAHAGSANPGAQIAQRLTLRLGVDIIYMLGAVGKDFDKKTQQLSSPMHH